METAQEDMKLLGVFGICRESHKIMAPWRRIFNQIALAFILPLCVIILARTRISNMQFLSIQEHRCGEKPHTYKYTSPNGIYIRLDLADFALPFIFSLLSTSAVVYTIACIYANRDVSFKKVMRVSQVCMLKRLTVTFILIYVLSFIYNVVASVTTLFLGIDGIASTAKSFILLIGFVYITTVWHLASVVTIFEGSYGVKAMNKSRNLTKGKFRMVLTISFMSNVLVWTIQLVFYNFVVDGIALGMWKRALVGIFCLAVLVTLYLYDLVLKTITYFVCKSYHNEIIDKATLSQHLGEYERSYLTELKQIYLIAVSKAITSINIVLDQLLTMY